uniref:Glycosyltransferase family 92 protein n=1 Tax=Panagrolaimus sp. ES5 TaxID=591445 RepID=A0AC34FSE7_9BILA
MSSSFYKTAHSSNNNNNNNENEGNQKQKLKTEIQSVEKECPWKWAPGCEWNSFVIDSYTTLGDIENSNNIILTKQDKSTVTLKLIKATNNYEDGLSVCIPPLYWFSDWLKLSFFIETWKLTAGTNVHFYFYIQSISKSVEAILKEYENQGIVTLIEWPLLPNSTEENPNESIYRFGHLLAQNDCRFRIKHRFGVVVDVDELILPLKPSESLTEYLKTKMKSHPLAGSLTFKHSRLRFPNWPKTTEERNKNGLEWIESILIEEKQGPTKTIFISDRADLISTHKIRKHFGIFSVVEIPQNEAKLFHFRKNWTYKDSDAEYESEIFKEIRFNISSNINSTVSKVEKILSNGLKLNNSVENLISSCLKK